MSWLRSGELVRKVTGNYGNGRIVLSIPLHFSNLECFMLVERYVQASSRTNIDSYARSSMGRFKCFIFDIGDTEYIELRTLLPEEYTGSSFLYDLLKGEPV